MQTRRQYTVPKRPQIIQMHATFAPFCRRGRRRRRRVHLSLILFLGDVFAGRDDRQSFLAVVVVVAGQNARRRRHDGVWSSLGIFRGLEGGGGFDHILVGMLRLKKSGNKIS